MKLHKNILHYYCICQNVLTDASVTGPSLNFALYSIATDDPDKAISRYSQLRTQQENHRQAMTQNVVVSTVMWGMR